jgi:choline-phosphate cytidylyltransferase
MRQLEQAKNAFPDTYLLVGVTGDAETHKRKGLTVLTGAERAETVRHCKWVDEVLPNCPWIVTPEFLEKHNIDYVAHDDEPYGADEGDDIYKAIKEQGKFLVTERTEGVSTTGIITKYICPLFFPFAPDSPCADHRYRRIVRDYEKYIARQFKRGASRQELNVSWLKKNELDLRRHVTELRDSIRLNWTSTGSEVGKELRQFWQNSRPASPAPGAGHGNGGGRVSMEGGKSPTAGNAFEHLKHLEVPGPGDRGRPESISGSMRGRSEDFAAGYSLGLIGGVRSWVSFPPFPPESKPIWRWGVM